MNKEIVYYLLIVILIVSILFSVYSVWNSRYYGNNYEKALSAENENDICKTPSGYTDEQWREHMSHHPDRYKQCLGG